MMGNLVSFAGDFQGSKSTMLQGLQAGGLTVIFRWVLGFRGCLGGPSQPPTVGSSVPHRSLFLVTDSLNVDQQ
jgi:hypothetical protein